MLGSLFNKVASLHTCNFFKKDSNTGVSCEYCKNFKNSFLYWAPLVAAGFELTVHNLQFAKHFGSLQMSFCIFSKNFESLKSDALWIFRLIHWNSYILSYLKPIKYPLLNNSVISQRFVVYINLKYILASFLVIILLQSNKL